MTSGVNLLRHRVRRAQGDPEGLLVLLHGRGTDELDLLPLGEELDPERRLVVVTPRAPLALPPGGAHWYAVQRVGFPDPATFWSAFELLGRWIDAAADAFSVPLERTVLSGFSQGAVMSYALGLSAGRPRPAALIALSGFIPTVDGFELALTGRDGDPAAIGHGMFDPVIPVEFGRAARQRLENAGFDVRYRESPMAHTIDPQFIRELRPWMLQALEARSSRPI